MNRTRVMIVDDHQVVRAGLKTLINGQPDLAVADRSGFRSRSHGTAQATHHRCVAARPVACRTFPVSTCSNTPRPITNRLGYSSCRHFPEAQYGLNVLRGGASGFVGKGTEESELFRAIRTVARGGRYVGPELADLLVAGVRGDPNAPAAQHPVGTRVPDLLQAGAGRVGVRDRESAFPQCQDGEHLPQSYPREDVHEE